MNSLKGTAAFFVASFVTGCAASSAPGIPLQILAPSWSGAALAKDDLIYVTNGNEEVTVYSLETQKLVGVLTHFTKPMGECVDASGNIYITDAGTNTVVEYAHGGSKAIEKFDDSPDTPYTCAVDPTTGSLAVANNDNIAIWPKGGSGQPTRYTDSALGSFGGCAYDTAGNLLTTNGASPSAFAWLPHGGSQLVTITMPGPQSGWQWYYVEGIQWDGRYFVLDSESTAYRVTVLHGLAYYVGDTQLSNDAEGPYAVYIPSSKSQSTQILVRTYHEELGYYDVESFDYPSGSGGPLFKITHGIDTPFGLAVSPKN
jgi:DNA-binding beta-propeller fold protein YncE